MTDLLGGMSAAASGMDAQSTRLRLVSENIANADTPGYRRKTIAFRDMVDDPSDARAVATGRIFLDASEFAEIYDPAHPLAGPDGYHEGSNVAIVIEIADAREAQRSYEANLNMFDQSRKMLASLFELLRR